jgi:transcriptional regulator with XRE-family HTH domain
MDFKTRIKQLREENGWTQEDLSKRIDIARSNISKYESGMLEANNEILKKLADTFGCTVDYLLGRVNNKDEYIAVVNMAKNANIPAETLKSFIDFLQKNKLNQ